MRPEEMTRIVNEDLRHIGMGMDANAQSIMRNIYNSKRRHDLSLGKSKKETLEFCLNYIKKEHPSFVVSYDPEYFV